MWRMHNPFAAARLDAPGRNCNSKYTAAVNIHARNARDSIIHARDTSSNQTQIKKILDSIGDVFKFRMSGSLYRTERPPGSPFHTFSHQNMPSLLKIKLLIYECLF